MFNAFEETQEKLEKMIGVDLNKVDAPKVESEEWIWVEGYKGTDIDMECRGYKFELNKRFDMPFDAEIKMCESGFHFCRDLKDVYNYYPIGGGRRFFKVRGLVRKADYEKYGETEEYVNIWTGHGTRRIDKLVATSIEFISELTMDEIFTASDIDISDYTEDEKKICIEIGETAVTIARQKKKLEKFGFSKELVNYIERKGCILKALEIGAIPDLSLDMKVWLIFKNEH